jgi:paraquat-inducible protein A
LLVNRSSPNGVLPRAGPLHQKIRELSRLGVLLCLRRSPVPQWVGRLLRWADILRPWSMLEVMLLGILVALTKIAELATVVPGIGMYAVGVLVVLFTAIPATLNPREVWTRVEWMRGGVASRTPGVASGNGPT